MKKSFLLSMIFAVFTVCFVGCSEATKAPPKEQEQLSFTSNKEISLRTVNGAEFINLEVVSFKDQVLTVKSPEPIIVQYDDNPSFDDVIKTEDNYTKQVAWNQNHRPKIKPHASLKFSKEPGAKVNENGDWPDQNSYHK